MGLVGGKIFVKVNGSQLRAKGAFTYNEGLDKNDMILGHDGVHGHKSLPQIPIIKGNITLDTANFSLKELNGIQGATVTIELADGSVFTLRDAVQTATLDVNTEEAEVEVEFQGVGADTI